MDCNKKVLMVMPQMMGGGAERVAAQIMNQLNEHGYTTRFLLTNAKRDDVVRTDLNEQTELILLSERLKPESLLQKLIYLPARAYSTVFGKLFEKWGKYAPASVGKATVVWLYHREIRWVRRYLRIEPDLTVLVFLQPAIPIVMLAARKLTNRVIFSERADPNRLLKKRYGKLFIEKYYTRADAAVFQTQDAKDAYPKTVANKGTVIFNPLKTGLPEPYSGERNNTITTFCRISRQKNLPLLVEAFAAVLKRHPGYTLRIIGDAVGDEGKTVMKTLEKMLNTPELKKAVLFEPFMKNVHEAILKDAVYVNSSDYEGISNAMLEAMAIGMPVVCTDCPIGGARAAIDDGINGLLVPLGDAAALADAINRLIDDKTLAQTLGKNASKIRETLSLERVTAQWEALL